MKEFIKSIFAGIMIGIAAIVKSQIPNPVVGSIMFSIGLLVIVLCEYNLYTGKIGYIKSYKEIPKYIIYIIGNFIGVYLTTFTIDIENKDIILAKMLNPTYLIFIKSIGCGFLMYVAVDIYKKHKNILGIVSCVPAFLLAGYEHSIADMFYICISHIYNLQTLYFITIVIIGNAIGAILHKLIK